MEMRAVLFRDGDMWVAQCLEHDIGSQGNSLEEVITRLHVAINAERMESLERNKVEFAGIPAAPDRYHKLWHKQAGRFVPGRDSEMSNVDLALCG